MWPFSRITIRDKVFCSSRFKPCYMYITFLIPILNIQPSVTNKMSMVFNRCRKIVKYDNIRLFCLLDSTADFGVKTNTNLTPIYQLARRAKLDIRIQQ